MVIEFIGTPGAGKTTLLPFVGEYLNGQGFHPYTIVEASRIFARRTLLGKIVDRLAPSSLRQPLLWQVFYNLSLLYRLRFGVKHFSLVRQVISSQKHRPVSANIQERRVLYWFFHLMGYYEFLKAYAKPNEVLLFDEGFVHRVVQLNASEVEVPRSIQIKAYLDLLPRPNLVIFAQAPQDICEKRIQKRGVWARFYQKHPMELSQFVAHAQMAVDFAVDYIRGNGWTVIEVDNGSEDLTIAITDLQQKLSRLLAIPLFRGTSISQP